ncbi:MAG: tetratricopeptide repeat protein [Brevinematia bacterium]
MFRYLTLFIFIASILFSQSNGELAPYVIFKKANDSYKLKRFEEAKKDYLEIVKKYPYSKYVPYSLYILSGIETDYINILEYLSIIKEKYPDFEYWTNSVEKLGEIYYVLEKYEDALSNYSLIDTDTSLYMQGVILSSKKLYSTASEKLERLLTQTTDNRLVYRALMLKIKILFETKSYNDIFPFFQMAVKLKEYSGDNGTRLLFYIGKYYFLRNDIEKNLEKSLYVFSLLKKLYPLSFESSLANNYLSYLKKNKIEKQDTIRWVASAYGDINELPYKKDEVRTTLDRYEKKAEEKVSDAESAIGKAIKADVIEYVVRIGEYKDLSVANMVAMDIGRQKKDISIGVFFRNDLYYPEVRGIKDIETAKNYARIIKSLGYDDVKVIEIYRVVEYTE